MKYATDSKTVEGSSDSEWPRASQFKVDGFEIFATQQIWVKDAIVRRIARYQCGQEKYKARRSANRVELFGDLRIVLDVCCFIGPSPTLELLSHKRPTNSKHFLALIAK